MSEEEIRAAYPGCAEAVLDTERIIDADFWEEFGPSFSSPEEAAQAIKEGVDLANRQAALVGMDSPGRRRTLAVLPQMDSPDFLRYCAAKLGLM